MQLPVNLDGRLDFGDHSPTCGKWQCVVKLQDTSEIDAAAKDVALHQFEIDFESPVVELDFALTASDLDASSDYTLLVTVHKSKTLKLQRGDFVNEYSIPIDPKSAHHELVVKLSKV